MLEIKDLTFCYRRGAAALDGVSMTLPDGGIGVVLGRNGAGKTTLFKLLAGIIRPQRGSALLDGEDLFSLSERERAKRVSFVAQELSFGGLSVFDTVLLGRIPYFGLYAGKEDRKAANRALEDLGISALAARNVNELSGGERQKVAVAQALASDPKLLIFDEPTGSLDVSSERRIIAEMARLSGEKGIMILTSTHDLTQAYNLGSTFVFLDRGRIVASGGREVFNAETVRACFDEDVDFVHIHGRTIII